MTEGCNDVLKAMKELLGWEFWSRVLLFGIVRCNRHPFKGRSGQDT
jgi:hypothetical protein